MRDLLTGFKYIGECITELEANGEEDRYVLGLEESYGYLTGIHARDKDGVNAAMIICEMAAFYKSKGITLWQFMDSIYEKYGYFFNQLDNYAFEGAAGMQKMADMMDSLRNDPPKEICGSKVNWVGDYKKGITTDGETGLPKSNVLSYRMESGDAVIVRPSGTEPKIKIYSTAQATSRKEAEEKLSTISLSVKELLGIE